MKSRIYPRWDASQVRQHQLMILSFTLLCATGLPLRYSDNNVTQALAQHLGGASVAGLIHRLAATGLILCCVWHAIYLCGARRRGRIRLDMLPALSDVHEVLHQLRWLLGLADHEARFGRYGFVEKIEYWALIWGSVVMIATGLMLWFPVSASGWVTGLGIQLAKVVHGYEALLAFLAILIWHMSHAPLRRDVFPMSHTWLTGVLTEEEMAHHHPRELEP